MKLEMPQQTVFMVETCKQLDRDRRRDIINQFPMLLSEAEPSAFGEEK